MIRRLSLSQRLALVVVSLLMLCAVAVCAVQLHSSAQYGNAMVQRLSSGLAQQIVAREPLLDAHGEVNRQTLKSLFDRLMTFNPSVELYLLSPDGDLLADAAPPGHIQRQRIDMAPVQAFLTGSASPVYGDDPRSPDGRKVFSAAPLRVDGQLRGYLYIILQGETFNQLAADAWQKTLWSIVLWTLLLVALFGLLAGGLAWFWVTRPVRLLTAQVAASGQDSISAIKTLAARRPEPRPGNEVAVLENRFIDLARQIADQWDRLADSDRQRREFVANISHDLRTPLTSLLGYLETLTLKDEWLTAEERRQYLTIALRQGNKVRHLSQQLFELARLEHGGIKPQRERFAMGELISDVAQKFELTARTREVNLHIDVPGPLPLINADVSMIERVVTNLLDNAMRHTPVGGEIRLAVWQENQQLQVEVADNGAGVDAALRDDLFQRPSALSTQASREDRGGLGLLIVKRMLELHGGDIRLVESVSGGAVQVLRATLRNRRVAATPYPAIVEERWPGKRSATRRKKLLREPLVANFLVGTVGLNRFQRGVQFLQQRLVIRAHGNAESGAEVLRVGHFRRGCPQLRVSFQPFVDHRGVAEHAVDTAIFQIDNRILVAVIGDGLHLRMLILQIFLVGGAVFHADPFAFQVIERMERIFFGDHQRRVGVVRVGEGHLLAPLRRNIHSGNHRIIFLELQRRDQAVKRVVGKGTFCLHLFAQRVGQIDIKADNLVISVHRFKRRIGCGDAKADFFRGSSAERERGEQCSQN
ncbi:osmosensitive K+ channel histidine kinase KdpD [Klebsiella pneumoniae]|nr:osmosensitive K+ channel histidine kinase KdpD [Klebsiella pneumoniae]